MNITMTLIGQMLTFAVFVWFIKRFLWEPILTMMEDRKKRIADGLEAAERGQHDKELAEQRVRERLQEAKHQAAGIINDAQKRAGQIVEEAKATAVTEGKRIKEAAQAEIGQEINRAKEQLRKQVAGLAVAGAERVLEKEIDPAAHKAALVELAAQI
jgi:F-type H+-transporting ATPase subunit b